SSDSSPSSTCEVVQGPIERDVFHFELIRSQEVALGASEPRADEGNNGPFDRTAAAQCGRRLVGIGGRKFLLAPREDRADSNEVLRRINLKALRPAGTFLRRLSQLAAESLGRIGLASEATAA